MDQDVIKTYVPVLEEFAKRHGLTLIQEIDSIVLPVDGPYVNLLNIKREPGEEKHVYIEFAQRMVSSGSWDDISNPERRREIERRELIVKSIAWQGEGSIILKGDEYGERFVDETRWIERYVHDPTELDECLELAYSTLLAQTEWRSFGLTFPMSLRK